MNSARNLNSQFVNICTATENHSLYPISEYVNKQQTEIESYKIKQEKNKNSGWLQGITQKNEVVEEPTESFIQKSKIINKSIQSFFEVTIGSKIINKDEIAVCGKWKTFWKKSHTNVITSLKDMFLEFIKDLFKLKANPMVEKWCNLGIAILSSYSSEMMKLIHEQTKNSHIFQLRNFHAINWKILNASSVFHNTTQKILKNSIFAVGLDNMFGQSKDSLNEVQKEILDIIKTLTSMFINVYIGERTLEAYYVESYKATLGSLAGLTSSCIQDLIKTILKKTNTHVETWIASSIVYFDNITAHVDIA